VDGAAAVQWPTKWKKCWSIEVGEGHASPIVVDQVIYQFGRLDDQETLSAIDLSTGKVQWSVQNEAPYEMNKAALGHGKGPKSTPVYADGKVFTLGISGILSGVDAKNGKLLWRREFAKVNPMTSPLYGTSMSPMVTGKVVIAHVGGPDKGELSGFDVETGKTIWTASTDGPGYTSPIVMKVGQSMQLITQTQSSFVGIDPLSGKLLWKTPFTTSYDQNSVTPLSVGELIISSGYNQPLTASSITPAGPKVMWKNKAVPMFMSSPVVVGDRIYGMTMQRQKLFCVQAKSGELVWESEKRVGENAALIVVDRDILALTTEGNLMVLKSGTAEMEVIAQYKVAETPTWAHPVWTGKYLLIKDLKTLTAYEIP